METTTTTTRLQDPRRVGLMFNDTRLGLLWLPLRLYLGWQWLSAGRAGLSAALLRDHWQHLTANAPGQPAQSSGWYEWLLRFLLAHNVDRWLAPAGGVAETLIGIAVILGVFTAGAVFCGALLNFSLLLPATGANPLLVALAVALMLAWKTSGWIGFDRWLLPMVGAPWRGGHLFARRSNVGRPAAEPEPLP